MRMAIISPPMERTMDLLSFADSDCNSGKLNRIKKETARAKYTDNFEEGSLMASPGVCDTSCCQDKPHLRLLLLVVHIISSASQLFLSRHCQASTLNNNRNLDCKQQMERMHISLHIHIVITFSRSLVLRLARYWNEGLKGPPDHVQNRSCYLLPQIGA